MGAWALEAVRVGESVDHAGMIFEDDAGAVVTLNDEVGLEVGAQWIDVVSALIKILIDRKRCLFMSIITSQTQVYNLSRSRSLICVFY